jgi:1-piperideine-2-carboxylate/1-pyrroline-2-carboxylate reductase [NAD(P)H]
LVAYFGVQNFWIAARELAAAQAFCAALQQRHPGTQAQALRSDSLAHAMPPTDLVIALTTSRTPVIPAHLPAQTLAIGVGAFKPDMAELPSALLHSRSIVVDDLAGARHEAGDLLQAKVDWSQVRSLADLLQTPRSPSAAGLPALVALPALPALPIFKTVGQAAWDLAAARVALQSLAAHP